MSNKSPIFIIGNPRSGTTLLRLLLTSHKDIVIPPESAFLVWWYDKYKDWTKQSVKNRLNSYINDLISSKKFETWNIDKEKLKRYIKSENPDSYSALSSAVYKFYGISIGKKISRWGDKNNWYLNYIDLIHKLFPEVFFIHIIRDGRDVAGSYKKLNKLHITNPYAPKLPDKIEDIALEWVTNLKKVNSSFENLHWRNVLEVKYENLVDNPKKVLKSICGSLDVSYDPNMLNFYKYNKEMKLEPTSFMKWKGKTFENIDKHAIGNFKKYLTKKEINSFENLTKERLHHYGYL